MEKIVKINLEMLDGLLESRKLNVSETAATKSADALIAYINQSTYGKWVINNFAHLSASDRIVFIKRMNEVLSYVGNRENFISYIKYSMKENLCKTIAFDCFVNDLMAFSEEECILSGEGFEILKAKYNDELDDFITEQCKQHESEEMEYVKIIFEYEEPEQEAVTAFLPAETIDELPFQECDI